MDREYIVKTDSSVTLNVTGGRIDSYRKKEETTSTVRVYRDGKIGIAGALGEVPEAELAPRAEAALALGIPYSAKLDGALEQTVEHTDVIIPNSELIPAMQRLLDRLGRECPRFALSNKILMNECRCEYRNSEGRHLRFADRWLDIGLLFQNRGAGKKDRVRASFFCGLKLEFLYAIFITAVCFFFAEPIIRLFVTDAAVVHLGVRFLKLVSLFYLMPSLTNGIQGGFRGLGDLKITLNSSTLNMAGRVAAAAVFVLLMKMDIEALPYSYVVGWILMLVYEAPMMVKYLRKGEL